jgi:hypothetical protein
MPMQSYRGHIIEVSRQSLGERTTYLTTITVGATGELRHEGCSSAGCSSNGSKAHDKAFTDARSWIERFPLRWPFPACEGAANDAREKVLDAARPNGTIHGAAMNRTGFAVLACAVAIAWFLWPHNAPEAGSPVSSFVQ